MLAQSPAWDKVATADDEEAGGSSKMMDKQHVFRSYSTAKKLHILFNFAAVMFFSKYGVYVMYQTSQRVMHMSIPPKDIVEPKGLFGQIIDLCDLQWRHFYLNLPILLAFATVFVAISTAVRKFCEANDKKEDSYSSKKGVSVHGLRLATYLVLSFAFITVMSGTHALFLIALAAGNYFLAKSSVGSQFHLYACWTYNIVFLYLAYNGTDMFKFGTLSSSLDFLDDLDGLGVSWQGSYNLLMLRMISFDADFHWMVQGRKPYKQCEKLSYEWRQENHAPVELYSFWVYMTYLFYVPFILAGPTVTFNAFASQLYLPQTTYTKKGIAFYAFRTALSFFVLEFMSSIVYCFGITRNKAWKYEFGPLEFAYLAYVTLVMMWLKFNTIWKMMRLWGLCDGIECPENMNRCVSNNYTFEGFWRSWHRSFNRWLIRYIYIPLGGKPYQYLNIWVVFSFVALWHEVELKLFAWAWIICLCFIPETYIRWWVAKPERAEFRQTNLFIFLRGFAGFVNICLMMIANLVGFSVGLEGTELFISKIFSWEGLNVVLGAFGAFYTATQVACELRDWEEKKLKITKGF